MSQYRPLSAVVLAAGEGTRMRSGTPKVLHPLCGRPMVLHVVDALAELPLERIVVVVGHGAERVTKTLQDQLVTEVPVEFVEQRVQRGTGDAVSVALTLFDDLDAEDDILQTFRHGAGHGRAHEANPADRERLESVLKELIACRQMLDQALKDG